MDKITEPDKMIQWIKKNWKSLKRNGILEKAIQKWLNADGSYPSFLPDDIIWIEENN